MTEPKPTGNADAAGSSSIDAAPTAEAKRKRRKNRRLSLIALLVVVLGVGWGVYRIMTWDPHYVVNVDEANRIILISGEGVNLIGIRCLPSEHHELGRQAAEFTRECILDRYIRIEEGETPRDRAGWIMAYVFVEKDGEEIFVNEELVRRGLAISKPRGLNIKYRGKLDAAQEEARKNHLGIWRPENAEALKMLRRYR